MEQGWKFRWSVVGVLPLAALHTTLPMAPVVVLLVFAAVFILPAIILAIYVCTNARKILRRRDVLLESRGRKLSTSTQQILMLASYGPSLEIPSKQKRAPKTAASPMLPAGAPYPPNHVIVRPYVPHTEASDESARTRFLKKLSRYSLSAPIGPDTRADNDADGPRDWYESTGIDALPAFVPLHGALAPDDDTSSSHSTLAHESYPGVADERTYVSLNDAQSLEASIHDTLSSTPGVADQRTYVPFNNAQSLEASIHDTLSTTPGIADERTYVSLNDAQSLDPSIYDTLKTPIVRRVESCETVLGGAGDLRYSNKYDRYPDKYDELQPDAVERSSWTGFQVQVLTSAVSRGGPPESSVSMEVDSSCVYLARPETRESAASVYPSPMPKLLISKAMGSVVIPERRASKVISMSLAVSEDFLLVEPAPVPKIPRRSTASRLYHDEVFLPGH